MSRLRSWSLVTLCASALALAACGSAVSAPTTAAPATTTAPAVVSPGAGASPEITYIPAQDRSPAGTAGKAPTVVVPPGTPPTNLERADLIVGKGPAAKAGDKVTVQYVLATYSAHKVVQSSWTGQPFSFTIGAGQVIPGWDDGVVGMKAGGRRELIIPPSLGYGDQSPGAGVASNDTLVFVIDVLKIG